MTPVDIGKLKELYQRATEPEPTNLVTHDSVERPRASTNTRIWHDWHHRRNLAARELLDLTPALIAKAERVDALEQKLRMVVAHATGGGSDDIERSVNDICVAISQHHNCVYQGGKDAAVRNALSPKESE